MTDSLFSYPRPPPPGHPRKKEGMHDWLTHDWSPPSGYIRKPPGDANNYKMHKPWKLQFCNSHSHLYHCQIKLIIKPQVNTSQHSHPRPISSPRTQVGVPFLLDFCLQICMSLFSVSLHCCPFLRFLAIVLLFLPLSLLLSQQLLRQTLEIYFGRSGSFSSF